MVSFRRRIVVTAVGALAVVASIAAAQGASQGASDDGKPRSDVPAFSAPTDATKAARVGERALGDAFGGHWFERDGKVLVFGVVATEDEVAMLEARVAEKLDEAGLDTEFRVTTVPISEDAVVALQAELDEQMASGDVNRDVEVYVNAEPNVREGAVNLTVPASDVITQRQAEFLERAQANYGTRINLVESPGRFIPE